MLQRTVALVILKGEEGGVIGTFTLDSDKVLGAHGASMLAGDRGGAEEDARSH